jgi:hypothetical protein
VREPAPYTIAIEGREEIKQLVEPRFHPHTPFGCYEAIEPHIDGTDRVYSAASENASRRLRLSLLAPNPPRLKQQAVGEFS